MGEVIKLPGAEVPDDWKPNFTLQARMTESGFEVMISDLDDKLVNSPETFRVVAASLVPIANGMYSFAEDCLPTERGKILAALTLYEDGTSDMHLVPFENVPQRAWVTAAFKRITEYIRKQPLKA